MLRRLAWSTLLAIALPGPAVVASEAPPAEGTASGAVARGALLYRIHCRSCHGDEACGHGPLAELLTVAPSDLTALTPADSDFPDEEVHRVIDGREQVRAHGAREMPVWGLSFQEAGRDSDQEPDVRARIDDLVAYLRSIQKRVE